MSQVDPQLVETVRGPIPVTELGTVLMHEHVFVLSEDLRRNYPQMWQEEEQIAGAVRRLRDLKAVGEPERLRSGWLNGIKHWQVDYTGNSPVGA